MSVLTSPHSYLIYGVAAISLLLLAGCNTPSGDAAQGKRWYAMHNCSACHGDQGNNGRAAAVAAIDMSYGAFIKVLRHPYSPSMPAYAESKLPDQDAADIYAYLKSLPE